MKRLLLIICIGALAACGGQKSSDKTDPYDAKNNSTTDEGAPSYDPDRGKGKFTKVDVGATLDATMATNGEKAYGVKCSGCHKMTDEKLVGPGWKGVTARHTAEWIMNFVTNTDEMLDKDPKAKAMLELCLVRMPNQNLGDDEARWIYEFMRKNDGIK